MLDATSLRVRTYCMQRPSNATHRATRRQPRQATDECTTLDGQAHLNLARPRQYSRVGFCVYIPLMYSLALRFVSTCARHSLRIRIPSIYTSAKIIQVNEYGCRDAPCEQSWKQGNPLSNTIKDTSTIMRNPFPELCREGLRMIVLVSLIVLLRGFPCFHDFSHGASLHPYSFT